MGRLFSRVAFGAVAAVALALVAGCTAPPPAESATTSSTALSSTTSTTAPTTTTTAAAAVPLLDQARSYTVRARNTACPTSVAVGTMFAVGKGLLVTNRHVVRGATTLQVSTWDGRDFSVSVVAVDRDNDLALVRAGISLPVAATLASADARPGQQVTAIGFPEGDELHPSTGRVVDLVSGQYGEQGKTVRMTATIRPGNSGGPLLDAQGRVVGVVFAIDTGNNDGLVIPVSTLRNFIAHPSGDPILDCSEEG